MERVVKRVGREDGKRRMESERVGREDEEKEGRGWGEGGDKGWRERGVRMGSVDREGR